MNNQDKIADPPPDPGATLDPSDWPAFRAQAHRMLDDMIDYVENIRDRPVWQPIPDEVRSRFHSDLPNTPSDLAAVHAEFMRDILPLPPAMCTLVSWAGFMAAALPSACWRRCSRRV
jgi:hypothetical protein